MIGEFRREHGDGAVRKIDTCPPDIGFFVKRGFFFDIVADIGDRDVQFQLSIFFSLNRDGIIKIFCIFSINSKGWNVSQIDPLPIFSWRGGRGERGEVIALIKPQFEAGRKDVSRGDGVIRDAEIHRKVLLDVLTFAQGEGLGLRGLIRSPITGPKGNVEFLARFSLGSGGEAVESLVGKVMP